MHSAKLVREWFGGGGLVVLWGCMKTVIVPAILEKSFDAIEEAVGRVRGVAKVVQVDVVDGVYTDGIYICQLI